LENIQNLYSRVSEVIDKNRNFFIITHAYPDGDSLGSQSAMYHLLKSLGKNVISLINSGIPYQYSFLPYYDEIKTEPGILKNSLDKYVYFCLDCASESRMNLNFEEVKSSAECVINIDHHYDNTNFGDINIVDSDKSATAEILYDFIYNYYRELINDKIALAIYVGILTDTGSFQYSNTNYKVHKVAGELLKFNLKPSDIHKRIYESEPLERFKLIQLVLGRVKFIDSYGLIYSYVLQKDFKKLGLPFSAQDGLINLLRTAEKVKIAALIKQTEERSFRISLRTSDSSINLIDIASSFNGGGHKMAAAYSDSGSLGAVIRKLILSVKRNTKNAE
jgi:bifunctional oligoribonuclease and PAP phosphatase NrnA